MKLQPLKEGQRLAGYSKELAAFLFKDIYRATGLPYTREHLEKAAGEVCDIINPCVYLEPAIAATWLHDAPEDIKGLDVFDPFKPVPLIEKAGKDFLNDLVREAGEGGKYMCYMVDKLTHRAEKLSYQDYFNNVFSFPQDGVARDLSIIAAVIKIVDRRMNINPSDEKNVDGLVEEYGRMKEASQDEFESFYKKTRTIDAFLMTGGIRYDAGLFVETVRKNFRVKQETSAIDNLAQYLPLAERALLAGIRKENKLFDWNKLRRLFKECYVDSLRLYPGEDALHAVKELGASKKALPIEGYKAVLKEIREDFVGGKRSLYYASP